MFDISAFGKHLVIKDKNRTKINTSDKQMFIKSINLVDTMQLGDWQIDHKYGFTIKWIGA